jgi:hypothetical protein
MSRIQSSIQSRVHNTFQHTLQHAGLLALGLLLAMTSAVLGAAGGNFILGSANSAGTSQSALITTSNAPYHALVVQQSGTGNAGYYVSTGGSGILGITKSGAKYGMSGTNDGAAGTGAAIIGAGKHNIGVVATSDDTWGVRGVNPTGGEGLVGGPYTCVTEGCYGDGVEGFGIGDFGAGVYGEGPYGIQGYGGIGVIGFDATEGSGYGLYSVGAAYVEGDLTITGTCTGCTAAIAAQNAGTDALAPGDAVSVVGLATDAGGNPVVTVARAGAGDAVIGVVSDRLTIAERQTRDGTAIQSFETAPGTIPSGGMLRVVTSGIVIASADASGGTLAPGASVGASATPGKLTVVAGDGIGYALGPLENGRVAILVQSH